MAITVKSVNDITTYRDGGSLGAFFVDDSGRELELLLKVDFLPDDPGCGFEKKSYHAPSLIEYIKTIYVSPITGISNPGQEVREQRVSWKTSRVLLNLFEPLLDDIEPFDAGDDTKSRSIELYAAMKEVVARRGKIRRFWLW